MTVPARTPFPIGRVAPFRAVASLVAVIALVLTMAFTPDVVAAEPDPAGSGSNATQSSVTGGSATTPPTSSDNPTTEQSAPPTDTGGPASTEGGSPSTDGRSASTEPSTESTPEPTAPSAKPAVSLNARAVLGAPNPLAALQGFGALVRGSATLDGAVDGSIAIGGDAAVGDYALSPGAAAATIDGASIGLLTGGTVTGRDNAAQVTVGGGNALLGDLGTLTPRSIDGGLGLFRPDSDQPLVQVAGGQGADRVRAPDLFAQAFGGVLDDLTARGKVLATLPATVRPADGEGAPLTSFDGADMQLHLVDGVNVWTVPAADLAAAHSISVDPAPTPDSPLVINVTGDTVTLGAKGMPGSAAEAVLWNVPDASTVDVTAPLAGSLLAPSSTVTIGASVRGTLVADSVSQLAGTTLSAVPFAAELPTSTSTPTGEQPGEPTMQSTGTAAPGDAPDSRPDSAAGALTADAIAPDDLQTQAGPDIGILAVPPATGNNAVITVKVGGDRSGSSGVTNLAGVVLQLYDGTTAPTTPTTSVTPNTCTSDADGDCSWTVPNTQVGGANRDKRFWAKQVSAPTGWYTNTAFVTGDGDDPSLTNYQFRTGDQLRSGNTYATSGTSPTWMLGTGNQNDVASGGIWQNSRNNPTLPAKCGLTVALILDVSGSVAPQLANLKAAAKTFTNSLVGTPSQVALFTFATSAPANASNNQNRPLTPVSTSTGATTVNGWIDGLTASGGTNWDRGMAQVAQSGTAYDVAVIITDGNPTYYGNPTQGPGNYTRFREMENGIFSANAIRATGTRLIAFGVGDGVSGNPNNLRAISGPTVNSDYFQTTDYTAAGNALRALALGSCQGSVSVVKQVIPSTTTPPATTGATPAGGWQFGATTSTSGVTITPTSGSTAASTGAVSFALTFPGGTSTANVTVNETQQSGFTLQQVNGFNAVCTRLDTNAAVAVTNSGATGFVVPAASAYPVSCMVYNRAPSPQATVTLNKTWVIDGTTYAEGSQPAGFTALGSINGTNQAWGVPRTGFQQGAAVSISEGPPVIRRQCTLVSSRLTSANGASVDEALPFAATLAGGDNTYGITNTVTCLTRLTLTKTVLGGSADPLLWNLSATAPSDAIAGPSGVSGATGAVTPGVVYTLAESAGDPRYTQLMVANAVPIPGSTVSWNCVEIDGSGNVIPGFADGLNGGVNVPLGSFVRCDATNQTATMRLIKRVINDNGGTAVPGDWTLTATPVGPPTPPTDLVPVSVPGSIAGQDFLVRPGQPYRLSETGPGGYTRSDLQCEIIEREAPANDTITLNPGDLGICEFVNDDQPARLTLIKTVTNGTTGGTAGPTDWTLSAAGPTPITGTSGSPAVTNAAVNAGTYTLSESNGPAGYTAGTWSCTGATVTGAQVTVPNGGNVSCSITNTAQQTRLTLVKTVTNDNGGTAVPTAWTLAAAGPTNISGATGSVAVTTAPVNPGTYALSETGPGGYTAGNWSCTAGTLTGSSLVLALGQQATCTINNNDQPAQLTLVKTVTNDNGGAAVPTAWTLAATGPTTISGATGSAAVTGAQVSSGTYNLSESGGPAGYTAGAWSCTGGGTLTGASLVLPNGASATCTINNDDQPAILTLEKVVDPAASGSGKVPADWTVTATPVSIAGQGTVSGNGDPTSAGGVNLRAVFAGSYDLSETGPAGFTPGSWVCQGGTLTGARVVVPSGGTVRCTITNTAVTPRLTLIKVVDNGTTGATAVATDWTLSAGGPTPISGRTGDASVTSAAVQVGTYSLAETGPAGYTPSAWTCTGAASFTNGSVTLTEGQNATCTITNTAIPPQLTLVKVVDNGATGGTAVATDWTLTGTGPVTITGATGSAPVTNAVVRVGSYALTESGGPGGYTASAWTCVGGSQTGSSVALALNQSATCTITNTALQAQLTLFKTVTNNNGGTALPTDWTLSAAGPTTGISGPTGSGAVTSVPVNPGQYALAESGGPTGYAAGPWSCTGATNAVSPVTIALGQTVVCTIDNDDQPSQLTLVKTVTNDNGGTAVPTDWTLSATGPTTISGTTGSPPVTDATVSAGSYTLAESAAVSGYTAGPWNCTAGTLTGSNLVLGNGVSATCTINNNDQPARLTLRKVVDARDSGSTKVPADWTVTAIPQAITGQGTVSGNGDPTSPGGVNQREVFAGTYALSESGTPSGFTPSTWTCTGGSISGATVTVPNGGDVTCQITNTAIAPTLTLVKVVDNGTTGGTGAPTDWTLTADGPTVVTGNSGQPAVTTRPVEVGTYDLSESGGPGGYTPSNWVCVDGEASTTSSVTLIEGQNATCTITNTAVAATLTLVKVVDNGTTGRTASPTEWDLTAAGPVTITGVTGDPTVTAASVQVGTYDLSESTGPAGYTPSDWVCTGAASPTDDSVTLTVGENATCTITNTALPAPTVSKTLVGSPVQNADGTWDVTYTVTVANPSSTTGLVYSLSDTPDFPAGVTVNGGTVSGTDGTDPITVLNPTFTGAGPVEVVSDRQLPAAGTDTYTVVVNASVPLTIDPALRPCQDGQSGTGFVNTAEATSGQDTFTDDACGPIPAPPSVWELTKTANPVSGSTVSAGSSIVYTLIAEHESGPAITGATAVDDLSQVLPYGSVVQPLPAELSLSGTNLTWTVPDIPVGGSASVSFTVLLRSDLAGGTVVFNRAQPTSAGGHCTPCETTHTVAATPVPPAPAPPAPPAPPVTPPTPMPNTGVPVGEQLGWGLGLLLAGAFLLLVGRRRWGSAPDAGQSG